MVAVRMVAVKTKPTVDVWWPRVWSGCRPYVYISIYINIRVSIYINVGIAPVTTSINVSFVIISCAYLVIGGWPGRRLLPRPFITV